MIWKEKERYRIRDVLMDNLRGLLGIKRRDKVLNTWITVVWSERWSRYKY